MALRDSAIYLTLGANPVNIKAKCVKTDCPGYGVVKSVLVGLTMGYGAENDRVKCPSCGELMRTVESINTSKSSGRKSNARKPAPRRLTKRS